MVLSFSGFLPLVWLWACGKEPYFGGRNMPNDKAAHLRLAREQTQTGEMAGVTKCPLKRWTWWAYNPIRREAKGGGL